MRRECKSYAHGGVIVVWDWNYHGEACPLCKAKRELQEVSRAKRMALRLEGLVLNVAEAAREWLWARKQAALSTADNSFVEEYETRLTEATEALDTDLQGRLLREAATREV